VATQNSTAHWTVKAPLMRVSTPWVDLIGERLLTHQQEEVDYWRVERSNSVIIVPLWQKQIILPPITYRPGIGISTLDFPGGRIRPNQSPAEAAHSILQRELGIIPGDIEELIALNHDGWPINSAFTNQLLFGFVAHIQEGAQITPDALGFHFPIEPSGITELLQLLSCLQCRAVLMELIHSGRVNFEIE
jgi:8-oxo-dGTP pyrophosphatase MutT (NUDIX family)